MNNCIKVHSSHFQSFQAQYSIDPLLIYPLIFFSPRCFKMQSQIKTFQRHVVFILSYTPMISQQSRAGQAALLQLLFLIPIPPLHVPRRPPRHRDKRSRAADHCGRPTTTPPPDKEGRCVAVPRRRSHGRQSSTVRATDHV